MERDPRVYLWDVQDAADDIAQFTADLDFASYEQSKLVRAAVERKFEIIGEALISCRGTRPSWPDGWRSCAESSMSVMC
jgi:uncharacterized protein with HEPN domain